DSRLPESNRCKRLCRPLRSHSAKAPRLYLSLFSARTPFALSIAPRSPRSRRCEVVQAPVRKWRRGRHTPMPRSTGADDGTVLLAGRSTGSTAAVAVLVAALTLGSQAAGATKSDCGSGSGGVGPRSSGSGGVSLPGHHRAHRRGHRCTSTHYVNPIRGAAWLVGRTDMGVDYGVTRRAPIVAIGDALVLGSS